MVSIHASFYGIGVAVGIAATSTLAQAYDLASGSQDGKLHRLGSALAQITNEQTSLQRSDALAALTTDGYVENARLLREDQAQFALIDSLTAYWVGQAEGPFANDEPFDDLNVVAILWQDVDHFVIGKAALQSGTIADFSNLSGARVSLSDEAATQVNSNAQIADQLGMAFDARLDHDALTGPSSVQRLDYEQIGGLAATAPIPATTVADAIASMPGGGVLVGLTSGQFSSLPGSRQGAWSPYSIAAGTYPDQDVEIDTTARPIMLVARAEVGEEDVYQITRALFRNLPALAEESPLASLISLERAVSEDLLFPLHPGATRYYQDVGLVIDNDVFERVQANQDPLAQRDSTIDPWKAYRPLQSIIFSGAPERERSRTFVKFFAFNSVELDEPAKAVVQEVADFGKSLGNAEMFVAGHADRAGSRAVNQRIARARADSVVEGLLALGYDEQLITAQGFGEDRPAISTADDEQHQQNRRVETSISLPPVTGLQVVSLDEPALTADDVTGTIEVGSSASGNGMPKVLIESAYGNEGDGDLTMDIRLSEPADTPVVLIVTRLNGTAIASRDFENSPSIITLRRGETRAQLTTVLIDDDLAEEDETFAIRVSGSRDHVDIPDEPIVITIEDDDDAAATD